MEVETDPDLIAEMRRLSLGGKQSSDILHFLSERGVVPGIGLMIYFCEAFGLKFGDVTPIGGWAPDGSGELSDDAINRLLRIS